MNNPDELELTEADLASALWLKIKQHLEARLDQHRRKNDNDLDPIATARLRGAIAEVKTLLARGVQDN
jgi:hypothetical protein